VQFGTGVILSKMVEIGKPIGLKDKFGNEILNGSTVEVVSKVSFIGKGQKCLCIFCTPQHRFGFVLLPEKEYLKDSLAYLDNPNTAPNLHFYATPRNVAKLKVI